jgi:hypothetical protein
MYSLTMNFSSRTTAADVQRIVEDNIEKRSKNTYARLACVVGLACRLA